jgi:periplasmic glucans biosynthesis protein
MIDRRRFLVSTAAALATVGFRGSALANLALKLEKGERFSFEGMIERARKLAGRPYVPVPSPPVDILDKINYEALESISFNSDYALFAEGPMPFPVTFFHLGKFSRNPERMHVLEETANGTVAREIVYDESYFDMPPDSPAHALPRGSGFAGFRFQESKFGDQSKLDWRKNDWVSFLGASYFRAIGELFQYGLSARGIAVDVAVPDRMEEFPAFTDIYFAPQKTDSQVVTVYALLDGPSIVGAYRFDMQRDKAVIVEVDSSLFVRKDISRFGIAPMSSMYWFSETIKPTAVDWRPEVHDSDGLALWTGIGERIWRPLNNPTATFASAFTDENPRGFGLLQRDRDFDHYQDGVHYELRPNLWVEPLEHWGKGSVQLVEIPTDDEIHDNVVAMWVPAEPAIAGKNYRFRYRLHWVGNEPFPTGMANCVATRLGNGGQPGQPRPKGVRKFMVEFRGGPLISLPFGVKPEPVLWASRGDFSYIFTEAVPDNVPGHWRAQFDFTVTGKEPVEMRLFLKSQNNVLSETWSYDYHPQQLGTGSVSVSNG